MSKKRAQSFFTNPIFYIIILAIFLLLLIIGVSVIKKASHTTAKAELTSFIISLDKALKKQSSHSYGSKDDFLFGLPNDVKEVCFLDRSSDADLFSNNELSADMQLYVEDNVFFSPSEKFSSGRLQSFTLEQNPLCIEITEGKIKLNLESLGNITKITASPNDIRERDCISVLFNGDSENKVDLVFIGQGYKESLEFAPVVEDYIHTTFLATEPMKSQNTKFNFFRIDDFSDMNCRNDGFIYCNEYTVNQLASNCPHDYIVVLLKRNKATDLISPLRSSAYSNIMNLNTADDNLVLMHEFGHVFANLADEYTDDSYYAGFNEEEYPNCDDESCREWNFLEGVGCFKGCSLSSFYRATDKSIMNNYLRSSEYGILNNNIFLEKLEVYG